MGKGKVHFCRVTHIHLMMIKKKSAQHPVKKPNAQAMCGIQTRSHTHEPNQSPDLYSAGPRDSIQEKRSIQAKAVIHIVVECLILKILALS